MPPYRPDILIITIATTSGLLLLGLMRSEKQGSGGIGFESFSIFAIASPGLQPGKA